MKKMRAIGLGLAGSLLLGLTGCHGAIVLDHPYYTCRSPRPAVKVYHRAPRTHTTIYVTPRHHHSCR